MKAIHMVATALLASGCATGIPYAEREGNEYRRENERIEAIDDLQSLTRACRQVGGVVSMPRTSSGRFSPTPFEMRGATCDRHPELARIL